MSQLKKRRLGRVATATMAVAAAASLLLTSCTASNGNGADGESPTEFIFGVTSVATTLNSGIISAQDTAMIANNVFDGLVRLDRNGEIQPMLATEWELSEDGLEMSFTMRDDATFHDGEPLTAEDVKFTLEEGIAYSPYSAWMKDTFREVVIHDDYSFSVMLDQQFAPLLNALTRERAPIMPKHIFEGEDIMSHPANMAPIGSGPYVFESWAEDDTIRLVANEDYWDEMGSVETVVMRVIPDRTALANSLMSGEIDYIQGFWTPMEQVQAFQGNANLHVEEGRIYPTFTYLGFNVENEGVNTPDLRLAINKAIDKQLVLDSAFLGLGNVPDGFIPSAYPWANSEEVPFQDTLSYDPEEAERLLDEAGYTPGPDGNRLTLRFVYSPEIQANTATIGEAMRANLADVGVDLQLVPLDSATYLEQVFTNRDYDITAVRLNTGGDPSLGIARVYVCNPGNLAYRNPSAYCDPEVDALWSRIATETGEGRGEAALEAQRMALRDLSSVPIVEEPSVDVISNRFSNLDDFFNAFEHASVEISKLR